MSKSPAVFDPVKLKWMNGEYMKAMEEDKFYEMAEPYLKEVITKDYDLKKIAKMVKTRIEIFPDIKDQIDFFEELPEYDTAMYTHKKMKTNAENSLEVLNDVLPILEAQEDYSNDALFETLKGYVTEKGVKIGFVNVADPNSGIRKTEHTGRCDRTDGSSRKGRILKENPCRYRITPGKLERGIYEF